MAQSDLASRLMIFQLPGFLWVNLAEYTIHSGQIIATSAEVTPNGGLIGIFPPNTLNSGLGIIVNCPDTWILWDSV